VIHEYLSNLKLDQIIDLGKLPEDMPLSNIIVEMNHKLDHAVDVDEEDDKSKANFAVSWRPGDYGPGKEKVNLSGKIVFQHLLYTCNLARRKIRTILALFYNLLIDVIPELDNLVSMCSIPLHWVPKVQYFPVFLQLRQLVIALNTTQVLLKCFPLPKM
jgi:hypothetical protein